MIATKWHLSLVSLSLVHCLALADCAQLQSQTRRPTRTNAGRETHAHTGAPLLDGEIDLENIDGIHRLTKLVLLKTDSLPSESHEPIDGRYLNGLMETLYTGLRKPFKSVSADILGIFPSFEEVQVRCDGGVVSSADGNQEIRAVWKSADEAAASHTTDSTLSGWSPSSARVCKAVTSDCLSVQELVRILPQSVKSFHTALVRLCPVMLFRIMNHLCRKPSAGSILAGAHDSELMTSVSIQDEVETISSRLGAVGGAVSGATHGDLSNSSIDLSTLQMLRNLQNSDELAPSSKRPQKLHKKLKTQTSGPRIASGSLTQQGVDEQLLKIRLKLSEPSIEKVWIFSLLFVVLSIVVSMGGLIVLPFVKKTTRRRILTLFEGLAVGGLAGSATLHMFPQAFGLVDENYHRYFWRIVVVFLGIYFCYLCERMIKILKVVRTKMRRRSRASLTDMDFRYGFPSIGGRASGSASSMPLSPSSGPKLGGLAPSLAGFLDPNEPTGSELGRACMGKTTRRRIEKSSQDASTRIGTSGSTVTMDARHESGKSRLGEPDLGINAGRKVKSERTKRRTSSRVSGSKEATAQNCPLYGYIYKDGYPIGERDKKSSKKRARAGNTSGAPKLLAKGQTVVGGNPTRQRLVDCLKSVQSQFSPVYAVHNQTNSDGVQAHKEQIVSNKIPGHSNENQQRQITSKKKDRLFRASGGVAFFKRAHSEVTGTRVYPKRQLKQKEIETMLYHRHLIELQNQQNRNHSSQLEARSYLQQRLSSVKDVAGERQDQDNAARMSVDTVAWMIVFGDAVLNVIDGLSIGAAFERNILAGISISVAVMLEEVTHRLGTFAVLIRAGMSMQQSLLCTFLSACALFPGLVVGILLSDATEDATPYIFCAAGGIFLYMALVDVMKEMNRSIENAIRKDIKSTLQIFALQNVGIILAVIFLSFLALCEKAMDFEEYQMQYNQPS